MKRILAMLLAMLFYFLITKVTGKLKLKEHYKKHEIV